MTMKNIIAQAEQIFSDYEKIIFIVLGLIICIAFLLIRSKLTNLIIKILSNIFYKRNHEKADSLHNSLYKPLSVYFAVLGIFIGIYINMNTTAVLRAFKIASIFILSWAVLNLITVNLSNILHLDDVNSSINITAVKFISNILKIVIVAFAVVMVISELGYNVNGLLTGLGVGGLAISLAAQDAVSNLISGFIIVFEKPFVVGEMIQTSTIIGTIEEVTMRSTKIRKLDDSVVTVPNSSITNDAIVNISRMDKRLIECEIGLTYSTDSKMLKQCQNEIAQYLIDDENILESPVRVNFTKFDASSLNLSITCYTTKTDKDDYLKVVNDMNFAIKEIVEKKNLDFAFPSQSIYIEKCSN